MSQIIASSIFSLKDNHSSTNRTALELTNRRKLTVFVFSVFCVFNCDTFHWVLYVASVKTTSILWLFLLFSQNGQPDLYGKSRNDKGKKTCQENIPCSLAKGKLRGVGGKEMKKVS